MFFTFDDFSSGRNRIDWQSIINQGFALGSQAMQSFGGAHTGTQFAQGNNGIFAIQASNQTPAGNYRGDEQGLTYEQRLALEKYRKSGLGADDAFAKLTEFISAHPMTVAGIALGAYLLFKEPPKSRR